MAHTNRLVNFRKLRFEIRKSMRYDDVGDYGDSTIIAYDMKDEVINQAILIHEFIEYILIRSAGIPVNLIDDFDTKPETRRKHPVEYELYGEFHNMANMIERQFIENLGLDWKTHQEKINTQEVQVAIENITDNLHASAFPRRLLETARAITRKLRL